jgi:hypothetical protein
VKKNKWTMPATIELEYEVPQGSDAVKEVGHVLPLLQGRATPGTDATA